jgi:hypothetical protein
MNLPRNAQLWFPAYLRDRARRLGAPRPKRLHVALCDHFEPCGNTTLPVARQRMAAWQRFWPEIAAAAPLDSEGRPPCYTFFYPQEEYNREILDSITEITATGFAEVEVHLHHFDDTAPSFVQKVRDFTACLHNDHGHLHIHNGRLVFGFIHGNWALDNSRPDGKACGVTGELQLLRDLGCYADFTMPSCPSPTQSRIVNQIYWTTGDPTRPKGFDSGVEATVGGGRKGDLLMFEGPLGLRFGGGRLKPRIETGELAAYDPPTPDRVPLWLSLAPRIGDDCFLKLFGHSAREDNAAALLGTPGNPGALSPMFRSIHEYTQQHNIELHWASAYRMYTAAEALIQPAPANNAVRAEL